MSNYTAPVDGVHILLLVFVGNVCACVYDKILF